MGQGSPRTVTDATDPSLLCVPVTPNHRWSSSAQAQASKALLCQDQCCSRNALCKVILDTLSSICELSVADKFCSQTSLLLSLMHWALF